MEVAVLSTLSCASLLLFVIYVHSGAALLRWQQRGPTKSVSRVLHHAV